MTGLMRLQKFLSAAGCCSRRSGEEYIRQGKVTVNGQIVTELGTKVDPENDRIEFDGGPVLIRGKHIYIALNKPKGYVTSCSRPFGEKIVLDLVNIKTRIYPIGRLDKDSTGLLLLTNDGQLHHRLSHPSFDHEKEYDVVLVNPISNFDLKKLADGVMLSAGMTRPAKVSRKSSKRFKIVLKEGKNRQIHKMVEALGNRVKELKRIRISSIKLGKLQEGGWRNLTAAEKMTLM